MYPLIYLHRRHSQRLVIGVGFVVGYQKRLFSPRGSRSQIDTGGIVGIPGKNHTPTSRRIHILTIEPQRNSRLRSQRIGIQFQVSFVGGIEFHHVHAQLRIIFIRQIRGSSLYISHRIGCAILKIEMGKQIVLPIVCRQERRSSKQESEHQGACINKLLHNLPIYCF